MNSQISKNEYIFIRNFDRKKNVGKECVYQKFNGYRLVYVLKSRNIFWYKKNKIYIFYDYKETIINNNYDFLIKGTYKLKKLPMSPEDLLPEEYVAETMNINELKNFIERKKRNQNVNIYLNEYYQRTSLPFSTFIFTILGFSISSEKRKGEIGYNIIIGFILAFFYIFFIEIAKIYSSKNYIPSFLSIWFPNIIFGIVTCLFYWIRRNK
ncbi:LptF/LptG family permease [Blattabacterium cuenoti]|uniref:LptF/LptG family permease n=1 Tax=Blattabacterium cuenoti TaxID=1653831 RepID=UPI00293B9627|nr:LptF/LptG family permease [Blattabacterium cuenoti]